MFSIQTPAKVVWGKGAVHRLDQVTRGARRIALLTDRGIERTGLLEPILAGDALQTRRVRVFSDIPPEPSADAARAVIAACAAFRADMILAVGGGSVMDVAKLASLFAADTPYTLESLRHHPEEAVKRCPTVMIPTTAGTGAEATSNAILFFPEERMKVGIVSPAMLCDAVILDPDLTATLPQPLASAACADALAHAIECYTSARATPMSDMYALTALEMIFANGVGACVDNNADARAALLLAAYYGGCAIAGSGTTAVHALSYPLGGRFRIPHGAANAILLMPVMRFNAPRCQAHFARVYDRLHPSRGASPREAEKARRFLEQMESLLQALHVPVSLRDYGVHPEHLPWLVDAGLQVRRLLDNNLRPVTPADARAIYRQVLQ